MDGLLLLDKPLDCSSNGILQKIKRLFGAKKAGHTGSLDPLATGMLPICLGKATRLSGHFLGADKAYTFTLCLGATTTTGDREGILTQQVADLAPFTIEALQAAVTQFTGPIMQIPPMYSALKRQGIPLYKLARKGETIEREPRPVQIYHFNIMAYEHPYVRLQCVVSKGTYIRVLAEDLGAALGCGAYVTALHRDYVTPFGSAKMYDLETLLEIQATQGVSGLEACLLPISHVVAQLQAAAPMLSVS